jgi:hypothetical protein
MSLYIVLQVYSDAPMEAANDQVYHTDIAAGVAAGRLAAETPGAEFAVAQLIEKIFIKTRAPELRKVRY